MFVPAETKEICPSATLTFVEFLRHSCKLRSIGPDAHFHASDFTPPGLDGVQLLAPHAHRKDEEEQARDQKPEHEVALVKRLALGIRVAHQKPVVRVTTSAVASATGRVTASAVGSVGLHAVVRMKRRGHGVLL